MNSRTIDQTHTITQHPSVQCFEKKGKEPSCDIYICQVMGEKNPTKQKGNTFSYIRFLTCFKGPSWMKDNQNGIGLYLSGKDKIFFS